MHDETTIPIVHDDHAVTEFRHCTEVLPRSAVCIKRALPALSLIIYEVQLASLLRWVVGDSVPHVYDLIAVDTRLRRHEGREATDL